MMSEDFEHQRDLLAQALGNVLVATGMCLETPMTGPELLHMADTYVLASRRAPTDALAVDPVGEAGEMPGSNGGFTLAVFKASDVPVGTKLFASPPKGEALEGWKPDREAVSNAIKAHVGFIQSKHGPMGVGKLTGVDRAADAILALQAAGRQALEQGAPHVER